MLSAYIHAAMRHAEYHFLAEDGVWYAAISPLGGVWAPTEGCDEAERRAVGQVEGEARLRAPR